METLRKIFCFICAFVAVAAACGCAGYLFANGQIVLGLGAVCLAAMAAPYVVKCVKELIP